MAIFPGTCSSPLNVEILFLPYSRVRKKSELMSLDKDRFCQVGLVVRNRDWTAKLLGRLFKTEAFGFHEGAPQEETGMLFRGKPGSGNLRLAFIDLGKVQLEIMEPFGGESTWQEFLDTRGEGIHHIAFHVDDAEAMTPELEHQGFALVQKGDFGSGRYAYFENKNQEGLGFMLEILEMYAEKN